MCVCVCVCVCVHTSLTKQTKENKTNRRKINKYISLKQNQKKKAEQIFLRKINFLLSI